MSSHVADFSVTDEVTFLEFCARVRGIPASAGLWGQLLMLGAVGSADFVYERDGLLFTCGTGPESFEEVIGVCGDSQSQSPPQ